jgi:hypothetical protein
MTYKTLSKRQAAVLTAMGRGLIPSGGPHFSPGAADMAHQWLPQVDYALSRMPVSTRMGLKIMLRIIDYGLPMLVMKRPVSITRLKDDHLEVLMDRTERSGVLGAAAMVIVKVLIFPAFYGIKEVQAAMGYSPRFPMPEYFQCLKE